MSRVGAADGFVARFPLVKVTNGTDRERNEHFLPCREYFRFVTHQSNAVRTIAEAAITLATSLMSARSSYCP